MDNLPSVRKAISVSRYQQTESETSGKMLTMDPLSVTASTLTVLSTLELALHLIRFLREAPSRLEALSNEAADVTTTVKVVARVIESS